MGIRAENQRGFFTVQPILAIHPIKLATCRDSHTVKFVLDKVNGVHYNTLHRNEYTSSRAVEGMAR